MEYGDVALDAYVAHKRPLSVLKAKAILNDIIAALEACQEQRIVHCDLKPQNILFFYDPKVGFDRWKLIDFDSACELGTPVTRGTLDFCAPESLQNAPATFAMDMFSLGRVLHFLISMSGDVWNGQGFEMSQEQKEQELLYGSLEVSSQDVTHEATRVLIKSLTQREPEQRRTLQLVKESSYISGNLYTSLLKSAVKFSSITGKHF